MKYCERGGQEVVGVSRVEGPIVVVEGAGNVGYDEVVEIITRRDDCAGAACWRSARTLAVVEVFAGTTGLSIDGRAFAFLGGPLHIPVAEEMLGRVFDGLGTPIDGGPQPLTDQYADINGQPINPTARIYPRDYIQTGISAIDGMNTLSSARNCRSSPAAGMPTTGWPPRSCARRRWRPAGETSAQSRRNSPSSSPPWA